MWSWHGSGLRQAHPSVMACSHLQHQKDSSSAGTWGQWRWSLCCDIQLAFLVELLLGSAILLFRMAMAFCGATIQEFLREQGFAFLLYARAFAEFLLSNLVGRANPT